MVYANQNIIEIFDDSFLIKLSKKFEEKNFFCFYISSNFVKEKVKKVYKTAEQTLLLNKIFINGISLIPKDFEIGNIKNFHFIKAVCKELENKTLYSWKRGEKIDRNKLPKKGEIISTFSNNFYTEENFIGVVMYSCKNFVILLEQSPKSNGILYLRKIPFAENRKKENNAENYFFVEVF